MIRSRLPPPHLVARVEPRRLASRAEHDLLLAPVTIHAAGGFINLDFDRLHSAEKLSLDYILQVFATSIMRAGMARYNVYLQGVLSPSIVQRRETRLSVAHANTGSHLTSPCTPFVRHVPFLIRLRFLPSIVSLLSTRSD